MQGIGLISVVKLEIIREICIGMFVVGHWTEPLLIQEVDVYRLGKRNALTFLFVYFPPTAR